MSQNVHLGAKYGHFDDAILHRLLCNAVLYLVQGNMKDRGSPSLFIVEESERRRGRRRKGHLYIAGITLMAPSEL